MPSVSKRQHNLMAAVANNPAFAKKAGIPQSVGAEFMKADKGLKFGKGNTSRAELQKINRPKTNQGKSEFFSEGGRMAESKSMMKKEVSFMKKKGAPKSMVKHEMAEAGMKYGGKVKKMANGGITTAKMGAVKSGGNKGHGEHSVQAKGHTKGKMIAMKYGGKC
jgi:hypothetical protein